ncbi:NPR3 [Candida theae]|uniref:Nitrogen permease regulator 3 n=1 Tax=Candida theae TaxID=1198502 RepID=A0AAD5BHP8_9ASCO|nr:NPR3 [Candida theae]KAI5964400.1 NPR3 [Candida theae]
MSLNLPNPSLLGILLVISTHSGPQLAYKYPTNLSSSRGGKHNTGPKRQDKDHQTTNDSINKSGDNEKQDVAEYYDEDDELYEYRDDEDDAEDENIDHLVGDIGDDDRSLYGIDAKVWDVDDLNYYMGTKLDLKRFLDLQDERRKQRLWSKTDQKRSDNSHTRVVDGGANLKQIGSKTSIAYSQHSQHSSTSNSNVPNSYVTINDDIMGIDPSYLCEMLAPPTAMCNARFEMTIEGKTFLGLPIHNSIDGGWKKRPRPNGKQAQQKKSGRSRSNSRPVDPHADTHELANYNEPETENGDLKSNLNMFHLVFIMNPPAMEFNYRIDEMFHHVISKLSLILRRAQLKHDYIGQEVKQIVALREEIKDENSLADMSSLCKLIRDCFVAISSSKVANLTINGKLKSFQIPVKTEFHSLPDISVPCIPGSYLSSTVNTLSNLGLINVGESSRFGQKNEAFKPLQEDDDSDEVVIYYALLLLDEPENIIRDVQTSHDSILSNFIRSIEPTESLLKLSTRHPQFDLRQIKSFAFHLIYWRKARIIQPLSSRSVYIISPMAPLTTRLYEDIFEFNKKFPTLPSLPHFLKLLSPKSRKPQQFAAIIPSRDHRDSYIRALAWLNRFGYATQQLTFIWLKISRKIKIKVEEDTENENLTRRKTSKYVADEKVTKSTDNSSKQVASADNSNSNAKTATATSDTAAAAAAAAAGDAVTTSTNTAVSANTASKSDIEGTSGSKLNKSNLDSLKYHLNKSSSTVTLLEDEDTVILDPGRASTLERKWINEIIFEECKLNAELTAIFYKLLKYMNGESPLELLLLKDNVSRSELKKLLLAIEPHIISVKHW